MAECQTGICHSTEVPGGFAEILWKPYALSIALSQHIESTVHKFVRIQLSVFNGEIGRSCSIKMWLCLLLGHNPTRLQTQTNRGQSIPTRFSDPSDLFFIGKDLELISAVSLPADRWFWLAHWVLPNLTTHRTPVSGAFFFFVRSTPCRSSADWFNERWISPFAWVSRDGKLLARDLRKIR
jgi:hypothetical protein